MDDITQHLIYSLSDYMYKLNTENANLKYDIENNFKFINKIKHNNFLLKNIENILINICNHEWIDDYIDDLYGNTKKITFCSICELTKK
jgi:uncharacterized membrane-anchored protein YjiN (DUF445 family)